MLKHIMTNRYPVVDEDNNPSYKCPGYWLYLYDSDIWQRHIFRDRLALQSTRQPWFHHCQMASRNGGSLVQTVDRWQLYLPPVMQNVHGNTEQVISVQYLHEWASKLWASQNLFWNEKHPFTRECISAISVPLWSAAGDRRWNLKPSFASCHNYVWAKLPYGWRCLRIIECWYS